MDFKLKRFDIAVNVTRIANIHYFEFLGMYHTAKDKHAFRELVYADSSSIVVDAAHYSGTLTENQMIIHAPLEEHALSCPSGKPVNVIIIGFECKSAALDVFSYRPTTLSGELQRLLSEVIKEGRHVFCPPYDTPNMKDMKKRDDYPFGADQMIKLTLESFLIRLVRETASVSAHPAAVRPDSKIVEIYNYINENYREKISLDELCFLYNTNRTTLCSQFKQAYDITVVDYINRRRIREAKLMLREGSQNITQIAAALGFSSPHYFSRIFKQYEELSPSAYAKTIKARLGV